MSANAGQIDGKTTMQKIVYFVRPKITLSDNPVFRPHFYGPYSSQVDFQLDKLVALGFLQQSARPTINDRLMYSYRLTKLGKSVLESLTGKYSKEFESIRSIVRTCKRYSGLNPTTLSYAAKVHHILSTTKGIVNEGEVASAAKNIGWKIDPEGIRRGAKLLAGLGLVSGS